MIERDAMIRITLKSKRVFFNGPLSDAPSSAVGGGGVGQRLFEFRNKPRCVWLVRASFVGRPR